MKYISEFRNSDSIPDMLEAIRQIAHGTWQIMEICGGQTHAIMKYGLQELLTPSITLLHGPGCPVCVTSLEMIEKAIELAKHPDLIFCSFGDMLRIPGNNKNLLSVRAEGADIRTVYSPMDAVQIAAENPEKEVVFFAIGFETTAPAVAMAVIQARDMALSNFTILTAHVRVPPAIDALLSAPRIRIDGFLAAGHVCTVMGTEEYTALARQYKIPFVITGFEPVDLLLGIYLCVRQLESGLHKVENPYGRSVRSEGNAAARQMMNSVFRVTDREWRGIGILPDSGLELKDEYAAFDAVRKFHPAPVVTTPGTELCKSGQVLQGLIKPDACPAFGKECTPESPLGATMVSSEGACAAYYQYRSRHA